ncbi:MAG: hypothetical protein R6X02_13730 [Enhygromyxa sp.]
MCSSIGCGLVVGGDPLADEGDSIADDLAQYQELAATLEAEREQALGDAVTEVSSAGSWLAWLDRPILGLRRYPDGLELELPAPGLSYRLGPSRVVTIDRSGEALIYRGFALPSGELLDEQHFDAPAGGGGSPVALLEDAAVIVELDGHVVWHWRPGVEAPSELGSLADAGVVVERVEQLQAVDGELGPKLVLRADGRLWILELESFTAASVAELDELLALDRRGALFTRGDELWLYPFEGEAVRIDAAIAQSGWSLNPTFPNIHTYAGEGAILADDRVFYISPAGVFAYALDQSGPEAITPILLEPRWDVAAGIPRIEYREPRAAGGTVFARGLIGDHGELGETGPIFALSY